MEEIKDLLRWVLPIALLAALALFQVYFRKWFGGGTRQAPGVPPANPTPTTERVYSGPRLDVWSADGRPELPREPEAPQGSRRRDRALDRSPAERKPAALSTGRRLRRLLAHPEGRRVAMLVHEILRPPEGCGRDETRRQLH